jgi:uncharacterized membrane protein
MKQSLDTKYLIALGSTIIFLVGAYLKFLYDVPDAQEITNTWVSWFLIALGAIGFIVSLVWKKKRNPIADN